LLGGGGWGGVCHRGFSVARDWVARATVDSPWRGNERRVPPWILDGAGADGVCHRG